MFGSIKDYWVTEILHTTNYTLSSRAHSELEELKASLSRPSIKMTTRSVLAIHLIIILILYILLPSEGYQGKIELIYCDCTVQTVQRNSLQKLCCKKWALSLVYIIFVLNGKITVTPLNRFRPIYMHRYSILSSVHWYIYLIDYTCMYVYCFCFNLFRPEQQQFVFVRKRGFGY